MATTTFTASGTKATTAASLPKSVFAVEVKNHDLLKDAYLAYLANGRENLAKTLKRGEISGGGRKPWAQKGTGRARFGSSRNPIWRKGGVVFGPPGNENYSRKLNIKAKRVALKQALTLAATNKSVIVIETFKTEGKAKDTVALLKKIGATRNTLLVVSQLDGLVLRATNNVPEVKAVFARNLNVYEIMNADTIILSKKSVEIIDAWLGEAK
jgi:large subunit ribosomal protein L4